MLINYLIAGLHGEEAGRYIFEDICALLILEETNLIKSEDISFSEKNKRLLKVNKVNALCSEKIKIGTSVYHIQTRQGDGGLDIIVENDNTWFVFQCKFYLNEKIDKSNRPLEIKKSFDKALITAEKHGKNIKKWILCTAKDLDEKEKYWWSTFKNEVSVPGIDIEIILNKQIEGYLLKNKHIFNHYFQDIISKNIDMELQVRRDLKCLIQRLNLELTLDIAPSSRTITKLSDLETYGALPLYIKGMKDAFYKTEDVFMEIDYQYKNLNEDYEHYLSYKYTPREEVFIEVMDKDIDEIINLINCSEVQNFIKFLNNALQNFELYFIK